MLFQNQHEPTSKLTCKIYPSHKALISSASWAKEPPDWTLALLWSPLLMSSGVRTCALAPTASAGIAVLAHAWTWWIEIQKTCDNKLRDQSTPRIRQGTTTAVMYESKPSFIASAIRAFTSRATTWLLASLRCWAHSAMIPATEKHNPSLTWSSNSLQVCRWILTYLGYDKSTYLLYGRTWVRPYISIWFWYGNPMFRRGVIPEGGMFVRPNLGSAVQVVWQNDIPLVHQNPCLKL